MQVLFIPKYKQHLQFKVTAHQNLVKSIKSGTNVIKKVKKKSKKRQSVDFFLNRPKPPKIV